MKRLAISAAFIVGIALTVMLLVTVSPVIAHDLPVINGGGGGGGCGGTTFKLGTLSIYEDRFYNYDFHCQPVSNYNVAWPVTMLFYDNAWINKVKSIYLEMPLFGIQEYARLDDGDGWIWDSDGGTKGIVWSSHLNGYVWLHLRVYAPNPPDYMYNSAWGKYVLGTTHYDEFPFEEWSGYSEWAEKDFASRAQDKGYTVFEDWASFSNYEPYRNENGHVWYNNGLATAVYVP